MSIRQCAAAVVMLLAACAANPAERLARDWARATLAGDAAAMAELTTSDWSGVATAEALADQLGREADIEVWEIHGTDGVRAVCVAFGSEDEQERGGLLLRRENGTWLAWEFRPDMEGCR